jgi:predicted ATPase
MLLESFRIFNFRSIADSGPIEISRITTLLGRNESGKSNLLLALKTLNPAEGFAELNPTKDFPRHRRLDECKSNTKVVSTSWLLNSHEQAELKKILPRAATATHVTVERPYGKTHWVKFDNVSALAFDASDIRTKVGAIASALRTAAEGLEEDKKSAFAKAVAEFSKNAALTADMEKWAAHALGAIAPLNQAIKNSDVELDASNTLELHKLQESAKAISGDKEALEKARTWVVGLLPVFIYLDEYPELRGHQNIAQYLQRKSQNQLRESDTYFEKLCKVAGLDPAQLHQLHAEGKHEERNQITNRASAIVTSEIRRLWRDRPLKVRFNVDADHFDTFVSDPTSTFDVEVNLDERSRGFRWFFSFYITFSADTDGGSAANAILLLDEPGLFLHIESQKDLQLHFERDFDNQIIYATHSPFMIPIQALDRLRTVNISEASGTIVTNNPTGDGRTLAPIRAALGYYYADSLFLGPNNLIVEGVTDWWILEAVSKHFVSGGKPGLPPGLALPPVDGAPKIPNMVSLLTSQKLNVLVLLDDESQGRSIRDEMLKTRLAREQQIIFVSDAFESNRPSETDIEDLIDPTVYEELARDAYAKELEERR